MAFHSNVDLVLCDWQLRLYRVATKFVDKQCNENPFPERSHFHPNFSGPR